MTLVPFGSIDRACIDGLVSREVQESRTLDYKEKLPGNTRDERKEFLADVSGFANAAGGDMIFGVRERRVGNKSTGIPDAVVGLGDMQIDAVILQLENIIRDGLEPRINGLQMKMIDGYPGGPVLAMRIPKSWAAPHMIRQGDSRFYSRNNAGKYPLDVVEIRSAFALSDALPERVRRFRDDRLARILANEMPVGMLDKPKVVLHLLPVSALDHANRVDLSSLPERTLELQPLVSYSGWTPRFNLDGYLTFSAGNGESSALSYFQIFRTGAVEAVEAGMFTSSKPPEANPRGGISSAYLEKFVIEGVRRYLKVMQSLGIEPPVFVMLSLLGVKGFTLATANDAWFDNSYVLDRDALLLPDRLVEDLEEPADKILQEVFDAMWQAAGFPQCRHYTNGRWSARA
jgi:Putative DNA-binding domain